MLIQLQVVHQIYQQIFIIFALLKKNCLINHEKDFKNKNIFNFKPINNKPYFKFLVLFRYLFKLIFEIIKSKPTIIVFEGAS